MEGKGGGKQVTGTDKSGNALLVSVQANRAMGKARSNSSFPRRGRKKEKKKERTERCVDPNSCIITPQICHGTLGNNGPGRKTKGL